MAGIDNGKEFISFEELDEIIFLLKKASDFDLTGYSKSSLKRRIERFLIVEKMDLLDLKKCHSEHTWFRKLFHARAGRQCNRNV